ncbi:hypothetical protein AG1IA_08693 [Rhizoctonia solani AG-1 IA]|uniref:Uncharacterized protein n=1 Tax=Thanatephorus cucumeris (strain AG1-IA) TaxID=983506 RepID=L8WKM4_THACA|nr:hypothetical protein AG1IA_08693 [Rhizoctonia solani AG-1 IA]
MGESNIAKSRGSHSRSPRHRRRPLSRVVEQKTDETTFEDEVTERTAQQVRTARVHAESASGSRRSSLSQVLNCDHPCLETRHESGTEDVLDNVPREENVLIAQCSGKPIIAVPLVSALQFVASSELRSLMSGYSALNRHRLPEEQEVILYNVLREETVLIIGRSGERTIPVTFQKNCSHQQIGSRHSFIMQTVSTAHRLNKTIHTNIRYRASLLVLHPNNPVLQTPRQPKSLANNRSEDKRPPLNLVPSNMAKTMHPTMFDALKNTAQTVGSRKEADVGMQVRDIDDRCQGHFPAASWICGCCGSRLRLQPYSMECHFFRPTGWRFLRGLLQTKFGRLVGLVDECCVLTVARRTYGHAGSDANRKAACKGQEVYRCVGSSRTSNVCGIAFSSSAGESVDPDPLGKRSQRYDCLARKLQELAQGVRHRIALEVIELKAWKAVVRVKSCLTSTSHFLFQCLTLILHNDRISNSAEYALQSSALEA